MLDHVPLDELEPHRTECMACGESVARDAYKTLCKVQTSPDLSLLQCPSCHVASVERMPNERFLAELYDPSQYSSSLTSNKHLAEKCARMIVDHFELNGRTAIHVADYGGGNGSLAECVVQALELKYGAQVKIHGTVIDIYPREDRGKISYVSVEEFAASDARYDIVMASAVLEHIPDVKPVIDRLFSAGTNGALFYARTPYEAPISRILPSHGIRWPRHVHDMGPEFWNKLVESKGARIIKSRTSIVETSFKDKFLFSLVAHLLKLPSKIETSFLRDLLGYKGYIWNIVGGWEVFATLQEVKSNG